VVCDHSEGAQGLFRDVLMGSEEPDGRRELALHPQHVPASSRYDRVRGPAFTLAAIPAGW